MYREIVIVSFSTHTHSHSRTLSHTLSLPHTHTLSLQPNCHTITGSGTCSDQLYCNCEPSNHTVSVSYNSGNSKPKFSTLSTLPYNSLHHLMCKRKNFYVNQTLITNEINIVYSYRAYFSRDWFFVNPATICEH